MSIEILVQRQNSNRSKIGSEQARELIQKANDSAKASLQDCAKTGHFKETRLFGICHNDAPLWGQYSAQNN